VRGHWGVENPLYWRLDVVLGDDANRIRKGNGPAIMTSIRHLCMNLFESDASSMSLLKSAARPHGMMTIAPRSYFHENFNAGPTGNCQGRCRFF